MCHVISPHDTCHTTLLILSHFHPEGGEALEQLAQVGCGCPIPGGIQGHIRRGLSNQFVEGGLEGDDL